MRYTPQMHHIHFLHSNYPHAARAYTKQSTPSPHILNQTTSLPPPSLPIPSPFCEFYGRPRFICKFNRSDTLCGNLLLERSGFPESYPEMVSLYLSPNFMLPWAYSCLDKSLHSWALSSHISGSIPDFSRRRYCQTDPFWVILPQSKERSLPRPPTDRHFPTWSSEPRASLKTMCSFSSRKAFCGWV